LDENCEFMVQIDLTSDGPIYGRVNRFAGLTYEQKVPAMLRRKLNRKSSYLDRYGKRVDIKKSAELQKKAPVQVYCRGFRNETTNNAYIIYWFFYLENFVPFSKKDEEIKDRLETHPDSMWTHEGDWEGLSMYFSNYQDKNSEIVYFSQHEGVKPFAWEDLSKENDRVLVIPGIGTHANFNKPIRKSRVVVAEVANPDRLYFPGGNGTDGASYLLEEMDPLHKHFWMAYKGRWGQGASLVGTAPTGPLYKRKKHLELLADKHLRK